MSPVTILRADLYRTAALRRAALALIMIALGLSLRLYGRKLGIPVEIVKYGGSVLWGAMLLFIVAALLPPVSRSRVAVFALIAATAVELFKLVHTPWLDGFRLTLTGALLLGRVFSAWDILAYAVGISAAVTIDWAVAKTSLKSPG